jgi:hypothetical protein
MSNREVDLGVINIQGRDEDSSEKEMVHVQNIKEAITEVN